MAASRVRPRYCTVSTLSIFSGTHSVMSPMSGLMHLIVIHPLWIDTMALCALRRLIVEGSSMAVGLNTMVALCRNVSMSECSCGHFFKEK